MKNHLLKVICWRMISILITMVVLWIATGSIKEATGLTVGLHLLLTVANFGFEISWEKMDDNEV